MQIRELIEELRHHPGNMEIIIHNTHTEASLGSCAPITVMKRSPYNAKSKSLSTSKIFPEALIFEL